jgi:hypothetical protein
MFSLMETISLEAVILVVKGIIKEYLIAFLLKSNCRSCLVGTSAKSQNNGQALKVSCFQTPSHQQTVEYYTAPFFPPHPSLCLCVCVCVCVWERERERESEHVLVHEFLPVCLCCGDFICFHILSLWPFGRGKLTFVYFLEFQTNKVTFTLTPEIVREVRYLMIIQYLQF